MCTNPNPNPATSRRRSISTLARQSSEPSNGQPPVRFSPYSGTLEPASSAEKNATAFNQTNKRRLLDYRPVSNQRPALCYAGAATPPGLHCSRRSAAINTDTAPAAGAGRRERILQAAVEAFAAGGFHGVSTREIAQAAGVTDALIFYHFKSKAALYFAAVEDQLEKLRIGLDAALAGLDGVRERLRAFATVYLSSFIDLEPGLSVTLRELRGLPDDLADQIAGLHHAIATHRLEQLLADGQARGLFPPGNVQASAYALLGALQMFVRVEARNPGSLPREDAVRQVDHFYAGLCAAVSEG